METPPLPCSASRREIAAWNFPRFAPCFYPVSLLESREIRSWNKGALSRAKVGNIVFVRCSNARGKLEKLSTIFVRVLERWDISTRNTVSFVNWNGRKKISLRSWCEDLSQDEITVEFSMRLSKIYPWPTTFLFPLLFLIERLIVNRHEIIIPVIIESLLILNFTVNFYFRHNLNRKYREDKDTKKYIIPNNISPISLLVSRPSPYFRVFRNEDEVDGGLVIGFSGR